MTRSMTTRTRKDGGVIQQQIKRAIKRHSLAIVLGVLLTAIAVFVVWAWVANSLRSPADFYVLPRTADDWSGWGTVVGGLGTTGALIYAALKFRSDAEEQRNLRLNRDTEARADATPLGIDISLSYPTEHLGPDVSGLTLKLTNRGKMQFNNLRVKIPDVPAKIISAQSAPIPPLRVEDDPGYGRENEEWSEMARPDTVGEFWRCGDIPSEEIMALYVQFDELQSLDDWGIVSQNKDTGKSERNGRIAVVFDDYEGRTWVRSTEGRQRLQRIWPDDFVV